MEERIEPDDVEVVGVGQVPSEEPDEEEEEVEEPEEEPAEPEEEAEEEEAEEPPAEEAEEPEEEVPVDELPEVDPEALKAEIAELEEARAKLREDTEYWRGQKRQARDDFFRPEPRETEEPVPQVPEGRETDFQDVLGPKPVADNFETYEEFYEAVADYKAEEKILQYESQRMSRNYSNQIETFKDTVIQAGVSKYEDFEEIAMDPRVAITTQMVDIMRELDYPEDVAYYLGRHPNEAIKMSRMTPARIGREMTRLEIRIQEDLKSEPPIEPESPQPLKTSKAPPPVKPVKGGVEQVTKDPQKMTPEEYREWRERGGGDPEY